MVASCWWASLWFFSLPTGRPADAHELRLPAGVQRRDWHRPQLEPWSDQGLKPLLKASSFRKGTCRTRNGGIVQLARIYRDVQSQMHPQLGTPGGPLSQNCCILCQAPKTWQALWLSTRRCPRIGLLLGLLSPLVPVCWWILATAGQCRLFAEWSLCREHMRARVTFGACGSPGIQAGKSRDKRKQHSTHARFFRCHELIFTCCPCCERVSTSLAQAPTTGEPACAEGAMIESAGQCRAICSNSAPKGLGS